MLDPDLYTRAEAQSAVDSVYLALRRTQRVSGGFFVTVESNMASCSGDSQPLYVDILDRHREADFTISSDEKRRVAAHRVYPELELEAVEQEAADEPEPATITYYYDYFGFVVPLDDPMGKVVDVWAQANDYSALKQSAENGTFGRIGMRNLTVFYQDGARSGGSTISQKKTDYPWSSTSHRWANIA